MIVDLAGLSRGLAEYFEPCYTITWVGNSVSTPKIMRKIFRVFNYEDVPCRNITVCYILTDQGTAVGYSMCSLSDEFDKDKGRMIAKNRAMKALEERKSGGRIKKGSYKNLINYGIIATRLWIPK